MELHEQIDAIKSKQELADFIESLREDFISKPSDWENPNLERYLEAMERWIRSMDNAYRNMDKDVPIEPDWKIFADILYAAKMYE